MRRQRSCCFVGQLMLLLLVLAILILHSRAAEQDGFCQANNKQTEEATNSCVLYLAPSSIPGAGFGVYTVQPFRRGDMILERDGPGIPVIDPWLLNEASGTLAPHIKLFDNVWWGEANGMNDAMRYEAELVADLQINFGALPNFHPFLFNLESAIPDLEYDDRMADRFRDPGAGAFSYHTGLNFHADKDIQAGDEIFLNYGEEWFDNRKGYEHVPRAKDYQLAGEILFRLIQENHLPATNAKFDDSSSTTDLQSIEKTLNVSRISTETFAPRAASLLPQTVQELAKVYAQAQKEVGSNATITALDISTAIAKALSITQRSVDWIIENGMCLDHIVAGKSTIKGAGQGAFAQRPIANGERIVPVPLLHISDREVLATMEVEIDEESGRLVRWEYDRIGEQLLVNYCFGHGESSLLLCPTTNAIRINHCSVRTQECGENGPNAKFEWAKWDNNTQSNLNKSFDEITKSKSFRILSLDIVALRDISEGEEIFIDYGEEWEIAWQKHVSAWEIPNEAMYDSRDRTSDLNGEGFEVDYVGINDSLPDEPIFTGCWYQPDNRELKLDPKHQGGVWNNLPDEEIIEFYSADGAGYTRKQHLYGAFWPCAILDGDDEGKTGPFTVQILQSKSHPPTFWTHKNLPRILHNFPRESIRYFWKPYRSDMHLPNAFRHPIMMSNDMFPQSWKNRPAADNTLDTKSSTVFNESQRVWCECENGLKLGTVVRHISSSDLYDVRLVPDEEDSDGNGNLVELDVESSQLQAFSVGKFDPVIFDFDGKSMKGNVLHVQTDQHPPKYDVIFGNGTIYRALNEEDLHPVAPFKVLKRLGDFLV